MGISLNPSAILSGQGINVSSLVQQVLSESSGQLTGWQNEQSTLQSQASDLTVVNNDLSSLATAVQALSDPLGALTGVSATSSDNSVLTATATTTATAGTHQIVVSTLATTGLIYTNDVAGGANVSILPTGANGGDLQLQIGGSSGQTVDIGITPGVNDTLTTLASYINTQSTANKWGVTATVVSDANGAARLALTTQATGTPGALAIASNTTTGTLNTSSVASADASILTNSQNGGDIKLQIGGASGTTADLQITAGSNDTLNTLASYINTQSTANNWGVTATVVPDSNGFHLSIASTAKGPAGALAITSNTNTTLTAAANPATNLTFNAPVGGTNANLTIDGIPFSSTTNTLTPSTIPGVTLNLAAASPGETVQLAVGPNITQSAAAVNTFVSAYNQVINDINQEFTVNAANNTQGPLGSDSALRSLQSSLLNDAAFAVSGNSGLVNLASLGINTNNDGTITVGTNAQGQTLDQVLAANPTAFQNFFQNSSSTGFANNFNTDLTNLTDPTVGVLNVDLTQNQASQQDLTNTINNFQTQLTSEQQALTTQFDQVNASLEAYPLLLEQITETLGTLGTNGSTSGSSSIPTLTSGL